MKEQDLAASICVLVVDDEEVVTSLVRDALEEDDLRVLTANNGDEALELAARHTIDLLITDIRMPGMTGNELAARLHEQQPDMRVIFMTGYANLGSAKDAIQQGALDYILKPFELAEIRRAVRKAVDLIQEEQRTVSDEKLSELSSLAHQLFGAGDQRSLASSSLRFAMVQQQTAEGCIIYRPSPEADFTILSCSEDTWAEADLPTTCKYRQNVTIVHDAQRQPALVARIHEHPLFAGAECRECLNPSPGWVHDDTPMVLVPVTRRDVFYGVMLLRKESDTGGFKRAELELLAIVANQLASALENLQLLQESRQAYARLKEMQDATIELEKMATRGAMSAEIGHELNNFLGVVSGNLSLLSLYLKKGQYDRLPPLIEKINNTVERMTRFTDDLMDLSSISSEKEVVCFGQLLHDVVESLTPQKRFRGVEVILPSSLPDLPVEADPTRIRQLLYNLFNNAADATRGCATRRIEADLQVDRDAGTLTCTITDSGVGFEPEQLAKAFKEQFTTKEHGHGFGLVVCARIVENHGGSIDIDSAPGRGTRISVTLPLHQPVGQLQPA